MTPTYQAILVSLIPGISWGVMWIFVTKATREKDAFESQFLFQLIGIPFLLVLLPFFLQFSTSFNLPLLIGLGIFETFVFTLYFYALKIGQLAIVGPINETNILITIALAVVFLHEHLSPFKVIGIVIVLTGAILLGLQVHSLKKGVKVYRGVIPAFLSAIGTGIYLFFVSISSRINGWFFTAFGIRIIMSLTILGIFCFKRTSLSKVFQRVPWKWIIPAALFDVIGFSSFNFALTKYPVSYVTVMITIAPVVSTILAICIFKERLKIYQIIGFVLLIAGLICLNAS